MIYVIIALIVIVTAIVVIGAIMRKKIYKQIDHYEAWKIDILNRPVKDEIAKVKELRMVGETEKKFEEWRENWDEIVSESLPQVEERLFDAEEMADKFQFGKAQAILNALQQTMDEIEWRLKEMLEELNVVVESDELNRKESVGVKELFHELKKKLITNGPQFKKAVTYVENELNTIDEQLSQFEKETQEGNVIKAREILSEAKASLEAIAEDMEVIPSYYNQIQSNIPKQLNELELGVQEMAEKDYVLTHLQIDKQVADMRKHLSIYEQALEKLELSEVAAGIDSTLDQLDDIYNNIEKEVDSRQRIAKEAEVLKNDLRIVGDKIKKINAETSVVQQSYRIDQEDLQEQGDIDAAFVKLDKEFKEVDDVLQEKKEAYSILLEKVAAMRSQLDHLHDDVDAFKERLTALRKDEMAAKDALGQLKRQLVDTRRKLQKSNLPGLPTEFMTVLEDGEDILIEISDKLDERPLEMHAIKLLMQEANEKMHMVLDKADEMVESAILTEQLIQYGNRYRSQDPVINDELNRAEDAFRSYNYSEAVEIAASAIYKVDKSVIKKFKVEVEDVQ
ncbi:septation ring formation regulator EzrA [Pullulanibacillus camelliae]|uniref:Septation ring formation regulator EzrA n=1 Tax=Pullulanibacillus camelliae TaxID=1707096 RepID=A0A8J2YM64_9BACL|nr:septation ring formation regulator EzrA [Pullulanibacillus camelliae]GGE52188.1 septation ring formation regulator EzrA [Pullulanibacillus camelliae]